MIWNTFDTKPAEPMPVIYFHANMVWIDQRGKPAILDPVRDVTERCISGYWDGTMWRDAGTGHDTFEPWRDDADMPTHWAPLLVPALAKAAGA